MRISDWSSDVCSSDLRTFTEVDEAHDRPRQTDELSGADDTRMRIRGIEQHFAESIQVAAVRNTDRQHDATMATAQVAIAHRARQQHRVRHDQGLAIGCLQFSRADAHAPHGAFAAGHGDEITAAARPLERSEEHTSELQSLMRTSYAVF